MKYIFSLIAALLFTAFAPHALAQYPLKPSPESRGFLGSTAYTVEKGRWELGLFGPLRFGLTDHLELSTHPIWFFAAPNLAAKIHYPTTGPTHLSTAHSITYPTPLMRLLARQGAGGLFPPERQIPHLISIKNEVIATRPLARGSTHLLTAAAGIQIAPRFDSSELVPVELPIVYPRTAAFFTTMTALGRLELTGPIFGSLHYHLGAHAFIYPGAAGSFALEQAGRLEWRSRTKWTTRVGYIASYGGFPHGLDRRILPTLEAIWAF